LNSGLLCFQSRCSQSRSSTAWVTPPVHFDMVILGMESPKLFAQAGLQPRFSQSQPPK
jgi:hypothetical protein